MGGWSVATVRDKKECMDCGFTIRTIGGPEKLPDSIIRIVSRNTAQADFNVGRAPLAEFFNDIRHMKMSAEEAEPYIDQFFAIQRTKGQLHEQFTEKLNEFREGEDIATRMADPSRRRYQPMTGEGRLLKAIKAALTSAEKVRDSRENIPYIAEYFQLLGRIRKVLQQIESRKKTR